ncbi:MAG: phosphoribosylformylglycinamidine cyclo-ligase [bacterium]
MKVSYKSSGVNIAEAEKFVNKIKPLTRKTFTNNVLKDIGSFGAFYKLNNKFRNPVLVSSVDGVGTKLKLAADLKKFDTVGEDLVNHCVNDIAVCGAVPLFFLDYYAAGKLRSDNAVEVMKGITRGCVNNKCSLIGGETAEMPGIYSGNDFDLAGAIVGIVEQDKIINFKNVKRGDVVIGLRSDGLHTNGYSLVRKIYDNNKKLKQFNKDLGSSVADELLKVHRSYLKIIQSCLSKFKINSISHITGGGIIGNSIRVVPKNLKINIDWNSWKRPFIFDLIRAKGDVSEDVMRSTFNLGIGLIFIVAIAESDKLISFLLSKKERPVIIGNIN